MRLGICLTNKHALKTSPTLHHQKKKKERVFSTISNTPESRLEFFPRNAPHYVLLRLHSSSTSGITKTKSPSRKCHMVGKTPPAASHNSQGRSTKPAHKKKKKKLVCVPFQLDSGTMQTLRFFPRPMWSHGYLLQVNV